MKKFNCTQCGACCKQMTICITHSDIMRWVEQKRYDILKETVFARGAPQGDGFYFEHTVIAPKQPCIFLKDDLCSIHDTKPVCCKDAPDSLTKFDACPVWDKSFINNKRRKKIAARHDRDFKNCVSNFEQLLTITFRARGFKWQPKINM